MEEHNAHGVLCITYFFTGKFGLKGELNLDNKWKSDNLFYIIMNEIHPRFNQFLRDFKVIVIYL